MDSEQPSALVLAICAGSVGELAHKDASVPSAIAKQPQAGVLAIDADGLRGDAVADERFHGGPDQALCVYPREHYFHWARHYGLSQPWDNGSFGENLTTLGLREGDVCIGDIFVLGRALVQVTQPRVPCFKPGVHNDATNLKQQMTRCGHTGYYLRVLAPGEVLAVGSALVLKERPHPQASVAEANRARLSPSRERLEQMLGIDALGRRYHKQLADKLAKLDAV